MFWVNILIIKWQTSHQAHEKCDRYTQTHCSSQAVLLATTLNTYNQQSINQSINEISIAPPTKSGQRRLTM